MFYCLFNLIDDITLVSIDAKNTQHLLKSDQYVFDWHCDSGTWSVIIYLQ